MDKITGGRLAAEALIDRGVDYVFSLSGGHITPIYQHLENSPVTIFDTRHEQSAVFMAEAYGRLKRRPGVALVTAGPGFTNALSPIANARLANSPLILIAGAVGLESIEKLDLQDMHQAPVISPMVKKAFVCHQPQRIPEYFDLAWRTAIGGRPGPVYLELPVDVLNAETDAAKVKKLNNQVDSKPMDPEKAKTILEMIGQASQPLVIAGSGAWYADAGQELTEFAELTGLPVFTSGLGRGTISDDHPLCFEGAVAIRPGAALMANMSADLIIVLGTRISLYYIFGDIFRPDAKMIQVDIQPEEIGRNRKLDLGVVSDVKALLTELNRAVREKNLGPGFKEKFSGWIGQLKEFEQAGKKEAEPKWFKEETPIHPMRLAREVNDFMDRDDDIVVGDGGDTQIWMSMTRTMKTAGHYLDSGLYGCLAVGLPYANAAQLLNPGKRVCLVIGDGSVGFNFMEFETAIRKKLPIVVVISNDLGWGMIRHSQELRLGHAIDNGTMIGQVNYHKMVEALGGKAMFVDKPGDIKPALEEAFASGLTTCINVMTDPTTISPGSEALANLGAYKA